MSLEGATTWNINDGPGQKECINRWTRSRTNGGYTASILLCKSSDATLFSADLSLNFIVQSRDYSEIYKWVLDTCWHKFVWRYFPIVRWIGVPRQLKNSATASWNMNSRPGQQKECINSRTVAAPPRGGSYWINRRSLSVNGDATRRVQWSLSVFTQSSYSLLNFRSRALSWCYGNANKTFIKWRKH